MSAIIQAGSRQTGIAMPKMGRVTRSPEHSFHVRTRPWKLTPIMIAPVLPGETMKNLLLQARVVTDPIKNPLIGWHLEYYFFYVKHRDLAERATLETMMLDPTTDTANALDSTDSVEYYHAGAGPNWLRMCLRRITEEYFRNEGEAWLDYALDGIPLAGVSRTSWLDSAINAAAYTAPDASITVGVDDVITISEIEKAKRTYDMLRANNLVDMTYEDFLRTYGVKPPREIIYRPELLRYVREWTYPTNTVEPTTGVPASACSWSIAERADKDRFFPEPGFIIGISVARPKVYFSGQNASAVAMMNDAVSWLPAILRDDSYASMKEMAAAAPPLAGNTTGYWVDLKDLLLYGDQFVNFALTATDAGLVALPTAGLQKRYVTTADADALFKSAAPANKVKQDGIVSLKILSSVMETSPTV